MFDNLTKYFSNTCCLIVYTFFFILVCPPDSDADKFSDKIQVEFTYQQKHFSVSGEKIEPHSYLFNKGGEKKLVISTLDWKPYIGESICGQGWVQQLTIALLVSQGYEVTSRFLPWARSIATAEKGLSDILYPEYFIESTAPSDVVKGSLRLDNLALSNKIPGGPIVFFKRKNEPDNYRGDFKNLKKEKIGVVRGYQNTPEFDALMDKGFFDISKAVNDHMNVIKLFNKRVNLIIGDPAVIFFNIQTSTSSETGKNNMLQGIEVIKPMIQYNHLYYAVSKQKPGWKQTLKDLNEAIMTFEESGLMFEIIKRVAEECDYKMDATFLPYHLDGKS